MPISQSRLITMVSAAESLFEAHERLRTAIIDQTIAAKSGIIDPNAALAQLSLLASIVPLTPEVQAQIAAERAHFNRYGAHNEKVRQRMRNLRERQRNPELTAATSVDEELTPDLAELAKQIFY